MESVAILGQVEWSYGRDEWDQDWVKLPMGHPSLQAHTLPLRLTQGRSQMSLPGASACGFGGNPLCLKGQKETSHRSRDAKIYSFFFALRLEKKGLIMNDDKQ